MRAGVGGNSVPVMRNAVPALEVVKVVPALEEDLAARTLRERSDAYAGEIRRLLDATYAVMRRTGELDPRVSDIVREAGLSNQAFYRHFQSKDELLVAVLADGQRQLVATLDERMRARRARRAARVRAWVEVVLAQARNAGAAANTRPFAINGLRLADRYPDQWRASREELLAPLRVALAEAGGDPDDAELVYHLAMGSMQDALVQREVPDARRRRTHRAGVTPRGGRAMTERELLITGIGGQGVQLAAQVLARAATLEGRDVMFFGVYGGMMRGGPTDSTVVVADGPIATPPVVARAWSAIAMHDEHWAPIEPRLREGAVVLVNDSTFEPHDHLARHGAPRARPRRSQPTSTTRWAASMVMVGAYAGHTGLVGLDALVEAMRASIPSYRSSTRTRTSARCARAGSCSRTGSSRGRRPQWVRGHDDRGRSGPESRHGDDRGRPLQGLRALHPRVPAAGADDVGRDESHGIPVPRAPPWLHGLCGLPPGLSRLRVRRVPVRHAARAPGEESSS